MKITLLTLLLLLALTVSASAQEVCPCVPISYQWIITACDSWNCAASAVVLANGDRNIVPIPTRSTDYAWIVLRRVASGSAIVSPDGPFKLEAFDTFAEASSRYLATDANLQPMLMTALDGKILLVVRTTPERKRAVSH
jgi:hypothetical protein